MFIGKFSHLPWLPKLYHGYMPSLQSPHVGLTCPIPDKDDWTSDKHFGGASANSSRIRLFRLLRTLWRENMHLDFLGGLMKTIPRPPQTMSEVEIP